MEALGPNLDMLLNNVPYGYFSKKTIYKIIIQLVSPLTFLTIYFQTHQLREIHELGYVHCNIKLENILICQKSPNTI